MKKAIVILSMFLGISMGANVWLGYTANKYHKGYAYAAWVKEYLGVKDHPFK